MDISSLSHSKWNCKYHIVFAPKYRRKVIFGKLKQDIANILSMLCKRKGVEIVEAEICPDYVHMLLRIPPNISVSSFMGLSYRKVEQILPIEIIELIQKYVDGECIYIPRKDNSRKNWGEGTSIRKELRERNLKIFLDYQNGIKVEELAERYYLSEKSIERIINISKVVA